MKDFPFIKCLNPSRILNRYTGENVLVECGKCEHCRLKRSLASTTRCKIEAASHRFTYFVTLTFENKYLPCARLVFRKEDSYKKDDEEVYDVVRESDGLVCGSVVFPSNMHKQQLVKKCKAGHNRIPIVDSQYPILFMKRLRKRLKYEKIRVFYCGEYGPVHFRPHYHFLLWFDKEETLSCIRQALSESWTFGRIDSSLASGKASSYVASYVNSAQYLPQVLSLASTKPFSNHSWYLGEQFLESSIKELQALDYSAINKQRFCFNGVNTDVLLWRTFKTRIFPKLKGHATQSEYVRVLSCQAFSTIRSWTQEDCPINQARFITDYVRYGDFYHPDDKINDLLQLFRHGLNYYTYDANKKILYIRPLLADYDKFEKSVYHHILASRYFINVICNGNSSYGYVAKMLRWIDGYYSYCDGENLKNQLDIESKIHKVKDADRSFFFHNSLSLKRLKENKLFMRHSAEVKNTFKSFMKHKELNDKNLIFNY